MKSFYSTPDPIVICPYCGSTDIRMFEMQSINIICQTCESHFSLDLRQNVIPVNICETILNLVDKSDDFYKPLVLSEQVGKFIKEIVHFAEHHDPVCLKCKSIKGYFETYQEAYIQMYVDKE